MSRLPRSAGAALAAALLVSGALAAPAAAAPKRHAAKRRPAPRVTTLALRRSARLWATVNLCDPRHRPDQVGLRASMPGTRRAGSMAASFRLQYLARGRRGRLGWRNYLRPSHVPLGSSRHRAPQGGLTWRLRSPAAGERFTFRGLVTFEWREGHRTLLRLRRATTAGRRPSAGSDPKGYSAARCVIRGPAPAPARARGTGAGRS